MIILVDTREQLPYWKPPECAKATLVVGDYTTAKLFHSVHIERKSPQDWYGTIIQHHARFRREIQRASTHGIRLIVVVESSRKDFVAKKFPQGDKRKIKPEVLSKVCSTIQSRYNLEIVWCGKGREHSKEKVLHLLRKWERTIKK